MRFAKSASRFFISKEIIEAKAFFICQRRNPKLKIGILKI